MIKLDDKKRCSGCHSCYNKCPQKCITMKEDDEGFLYPYVNEQNCISCGKCKVVCPILNKYKGHPKGNAYACINKNEKIRLNSSSGGIFTLIAEWVIDCGGVVFGVVFDSELNAYHTEIDTKEGLYKLCGSKYLQSRINNTYSKAEKYLKQERKVLFAGTPCQISGLRTYLGKEYDNLIMQDIICHGVPSPMVWQKYLEYQSKINKSPVDRESFPTFRRKDEGWKRYSVSFKFLNDTEYKETIDKDLYMRAFLSNICLRPSCYNCHSKSLERESDITLADFWGIENILPEMFDDKGTSLVLVNTEKGQSVFDAISKGMEYKAVDIDEAAKYNSAAFKSCIEPEKREWFMQNITADNFDKCVRKCTNPSLTKRFEREVKAVLKRIYKMCIGYK